MPSRVTQIFLFLAGLLVLAVSRFHHSPSTEDVVANSNKEGTSNKATTVAAAIALVILTILSGVSVGFLVSINLTYTAIGFAATMLGLILSVATRRVDKFWPYGIGLLTGVIGMLATAGSLVSESGTTPSD